MDYYNPFDAELALDELTEFWMEHGLTYRQAARLSLYQVVGNLFGDTTKTTPRPEA